MKANEFISEDWNKVNRHDKTNGLSQKAVNAYRREHPGSKLKTAVTTKPSKLKKGSKASKRRKSFCARMSGNKGPMKKPNGKPTPKALALRRWHCESIEEMAQMIAEGEQMIAELKKGAKDSNGFTKCWPGKHAEGTKKGKNGGQVRNCVPNESLSESITPQTIHKLADRKGIKWDDEPSFLKLTKRLTGKEHLDDLDQSELAKVKKHLDSVEENFADGRHPEDKGDSKRHGINTKASVSSLRKTAKQGGRKGQLAHWLANMKAGRAKAKK